VRVFENTAQENARTLLELNSEQFRMLHKGEYLDLYTVIPQLTSDPANEFFG